MKKATLIVGIGAFVVSLGLTLLFPLCTSCFALLVGPVAGLLAVYWGYPTEEQQAAGIGAQAGALAGVGLLAGQVLGGLLNAILVGPEGAAEIYRSLGLNIAEPSNIVAYYLGVVGGQMCCALVNVGIMAGLGALAAFLYFKSSNRPPQDEYQSRQV